MTKRVFLVDDEEDMTQLLATMLRYKGYELACANDPELALERLLSEDYDALVLDLMMPRLDGMALLDMLRSKGKTLPVLVLSAKNLSDDERQALLSRGARFLSKPVAPARLAQAVQEAIAAA